MSDIIKKLTENIVSVPSAPKPSIVDKLKVTTGPHGPKSSSIVAKLAALVPPMPEAPKQDGPIIVGMFTPYNASDTSGLIKALATVEEKTGKIGKIYFDGGFKIAVDLPRLVHKYDFIACVRDHPQILRAYEHLAGTFGPADPIERVRINLDDQNRLLRRREEDAIDDIIAMGAKVFVVMPGSTRMPLVEMAASANDIHVHLAPPQDGLTYSNEIELPEPPTNILVVTPEFHTDVAFLLMTIEHLALRDRPVGKIIHTPSPSMEVVALAAPGILLEEVPLEAALADPLRLFATKPDCVVVAGNDPLAGVVATEAEQRGIALIEFP